MRLKDSDHDDLYKNYRLLLLKVFIFVTYLSKKYMSINHYKIHIKYIHIQTNDGFIFRFFFQKFSLLTFEYYV